jgi:hypothetical protein
LEELVKLGMVALVAGLGAYFGSYLKAKGENLATHEDIGKVLDQVRAVTTTTKEIEAKISSSVWDRQKRWELKRDVLFEAAKRLSEIENALNSLNAVLQVELANPKQTEQEVWCKERSERLTRWSAASAAFDETRMLVGVVCGAEARESFDRYGTFSNVIARAILQNNGDIYGQSQKELIKRAFTINKTMRKELGIDIPDDLKTPSTPLLPPRNEV